MDRIQRGQETGLCPACGMPAPVFASIVSPETEAIAQACGSCQPWLAPFLAHARRNRLLRESRN